jgi:hypothetical protein
MNFLRTVGSIAAAICLAARLSGGPLPGPELRAEIPFAFQVGGKVHQPGTYSVSASASKGMVAITDSSGRPQLAFAVSTAGSWDWSSSKLRFVNRGGVMSLSEVHINTVVYQVTAPRNAVRPVEIAMVR